MMAMQAMQQKQQEEQAKKAREAQIMSRQQSSLGSAPVAQAPAAPQQGPGLAVPQGGAAAAFEAKGGPTEADPNDPQYKNWLANKGFGSF